MIADTWPACACKGGCPQMVEHSPNGCSVIPTILADAILADRPLMDGERDAIHDADERRRTRGYEGPRVLGWADAVTPRSGR